LQPIRTAAEITAQIKIYPVRRVYMYQKLSQKAKKLRLLGMSYEQIAKSLNISKKTVINACKYEKV
jgi:DNA-binding NarL/FixJ family response regulator